MAYQLGSGMWSGVFAVPNRVADEHLRLASGLAVKVLLLLLRHNGGQNTQQMAQALGQSVADIQDAVSYWLNLGILLEEGAAADPSPQEQPPAAVLAYQEVADPPPDTTRAEAPQKVTTLSSARPRLSTAQINELAGQDTALAGLLQEAQSVFGKPLSPVASSTMASLYSYNGMQPDLILMLVHYCISTGKDNMRYIERMADDWVDKGIDSHEKAEAEILRLMQLQQAETRIKSAFGIQDRGLISSEKKYIRTWTEQFGFEIPLIQLAFERAVEMKGKLSFAYINGILSNWHAKGIRTPAQAVEEIKGGKPLQQEEASGASYNLDELEKLIDFESL